MKPIVVVQGAVALDDLPGLDALADEAELHFAPDSGSLGRALPGADVLLGWNFRESNLETAWSHATALRWIHWCGAGVDDVLFPGLVQSDVVLTNARGIFDRAMAEFVLGLMIAMAKGFPRMFADQLHGRWVHRLTERLDGKCALVVGAGSIGREIGRMLKAFGMNVGAVSKRARADDPDFGTVAPISELDEQLPWADYVFVVTPLTRDTVGLFGTAQFEAMKRSARIINVGRGKVLDEEALVVALDRGDISGAALDVFGEEPLPTDSPLWTRDDVIVAPHMSGDFFGFEEALVERFVENFRRFTAGQALEGVVDKQKGYVADQV